MKHRNTRELYDYWSRLRGTEAAPSRGAIEPADIHALLGDTFILETGGPGRYPFRLAGTRLCAHFGRELKGSNFLGLWSGADREAIGTLLSAVCGDAAAAILGVEASSERGQTAAFEMVILPLSRGGRIYDRILGLMAPLDRPYWLGVQPVTRQSVTSLSLIAPDERPASIRPTMPMPSLEAMMALRDRAGHAGDLLKEDGPPAMPAGALAGGRRHNHLIVLDGGRR